MFNNVAFEVVIGLVFIYLLYSLLMTILGEIISTKLGIRARLLRVAIERMMNDGYYEKIEEKYNKQIQGWLRKEFLYEADEFKKSFAGQFYEYPAIKYLGRIEDNYRGIFSSTKPSYISADYFADTLINFLADRGEGKKAMDKIAFCLRFNTYRIQPKTLKQFRNLFENAGGRQVIYKQNLMKWFNETMDRNNGWYKRKMRAILFWMGLMIAIAFNIDSIRIAKILAIDKEARSQLVSMGVELAKDSLRYKDIIRHNGDSVFAKNVIDSGFNRVTQDINAANLVLGLGWGFDKLEKRDSIEFVRADDTIKFKNLQYWLPDYKNLYDAISTLLKDRKTRLNVIKNKNDSLSLVIADTIIKSRQINYTKNKLALNEVLFNSLDSIGLIQKSILALLIENRIDSISYLTKYAEANRIKDSINGLAKSNFLRIDNFDSTRDGSKIVISGPRKYTCGEMTGQFFHEVFAENGWIGFLITAFALCLGAPFWFDVLVRLVAIRGAGVKPEEKKLTGHVLISEPIQDVKDLPEIPNSKLTPMRLAINRLIAKFDKNSEIISIEEGFIKRNNVKVEAIEIHIKNTSIEEFLIKEIGNEYESFLINYLVNTDTVTLGGSSGDSIYNETKRNGFGTVGCILENAESKKRYLLSCWHVLKGTIDFNDDSGPSIIMAGNQRIAKLSDGCLSSNMDIGFAELNQDFEINNHVLNIREKWRHVLKDDAKNEIEVYFVGASSGPKGNQPNDKIVVYNHIVTKEIEYPDKTIKELEDLFSITKYVNDLPTSPSKKGDSGSLILDKNGSPLGIIVGANSNFTYCVKLSNAFMEGSLYHQYSNII